MKKYQSLIIFDTEYTAWPGSQETGWSRPGEYREIVQIGAVRLASSYREIETFELIVKPVLNPILSDYFVALTGINQRQVDLQGRRFSEAWEKFSEFLTRELVAIYSNGSD